MKNIKRIDFFGLPLSSFRINELSTILSNRIKGGSTTTCFGYSLGSIARIKKYPEIFTNTKDFDLLVADGRWLYILTKMLKFPIGDELSIPNLVRLLLTLCNKNSLSVMLVGATNKINQKAIKSIKLKFPNIKDVIGIDGYFEDSNRDSITNLINKSNPDVLLIGISSPKMEILANYWSKTTNSKIILPCGGMIDVLGGKTKQTPNILKKIGVASLYRLIQEPKRLFFRRMFGYYFVFFRFFPKLLFSKTFNKRFSIPSFCGID